MSMNVPRFAKFMITDRANVLVPVVTRLGTRISFIEAKPGPITYADIRAQLAASTINQIGDGFAFLRKFQSQDVDDDNDAQLLPLDRAKEATTMFVVEAATRKYVFIELGDVEPSSLSAPSTVKRVEAESLKAPVYRVSDVVRNNNQQDNDGSAGETNGKLRSSAARVRLPVVAERHLSSNKSPSSEPRAPDRRLFSTARSRIRKATRRRMDVNMPDSPGDVELEDFSPDGHITQRQSYHPDGATQRRDNAAFSSHATTPSYVSLSAVDDVELEEPESDHRAATTVELFDMERGALRSVGGPSTFSQLLSVRWLVDGNMSRASQFLQNRSSTSRVMRIFDLIDWHLRSFGQVIFVNNTISGAVIFTSLTVASPMQGLLALLGCSSSIASALLLKLDSDAIRAGLHGYNGVLIGCAVSAFDANVWQQVGIAIAGGVLCNFYGVFLGKLLNRTFNVAPLTFPFNLTLIALMTAVRVTFPATDELSAHEGHAVEPPLDAEFFVLAALRGVAQVFVSSNEWVGLAMLFGVLVSSRFMALYFALGSIVGIAMGFALGREHTDIGAGTWGYNSVLAAGAVAFFFRLDSRSMLMPLFNAAFCALFYAALPRPSLTLAFCLGSAVVLTMQSSVPYLAAVPFFELSSPEQHREAQRKRDALEQP